MFDQRYTKKFPVNLQIPSQGHNRRSTDNLLIVAQVNQNNSELLSSSGFGVVFAALTSIYSVHTVTTSILIISLVIYTYIYFRILTTPNLSITQLYQLQIEIELLPADIADKKTLQYIRRKTAGHQAVIKNPSCFQKYRWFSTVLKFVL